MGPWSKISTRNRSFLKKTIFAPIMGDLDMLVVMLKICRLEDQVKDKFAERIQKRGKIFENTKKLCGKYTKMLITLYTSDDILGKLKIETCVTELDR